MNCKRELKDLIRKINSLPYNVKNVSLVEDYFSMLQYARVCEFLTPEEDEQLSTIDSNFLVQRYSYLKDKKIFNNEISLVSSCELINEILKDIFDEMKEYNIYGTIYNRVNDDVMAEVVYDFFNFLGKDILDYYKELLRKGLIEEKNNIESGGTTYLTVNLNSPIVLKSYDDFYFYEALVHEVGHSYAGMLQRNLSSLNSFNSFVEFPSVLFQKLFVEYVSNNHVLDSKSIKKIKMNSVYMNLKTMKKAYMFNSFLLKYLEEGSYLGFDYEIQAYEDENLLNSILPNIRLDSNDKLVLYNNTYVIGNLLTNEFINRIYCDKKEGLKEVKNFIMLSNRYDLYDTLEGIDSNCTKDRLKSFIK